MKYFILLFFLASSKQTLSQTGIDVSEQLINVSIKIKVVEKEIIKNNLKQIIGATGTGFFFEYTLGTKKVPVIVTNKHVIKDAIRGILIFTLMGSNGKPAYGKTDTITINNFKSKWIYHPDSTVDLAILPIQNIIDNNKKLGKPIFCDPISEISIPSISIAQDFSGIEDIYMIGYPFGRKDEINNIPIIRKGITATPYYLNYENKKEFLADIPVYFGSSGSPVVIYSRGYNDKRGGFYNGIRFHLIGINYATYTRGFEGKIVPKLSYNFDAPDSLVTTTQIPYNIGIIIKSERLLDIKPLLKDFIK